MKEKNKIRGKKARASGQRFELKVRKDLESKGWICDKWSNNVSDFPEENINLPPEKREDRKLIPAKRKYNPFNKALAIGTGFPDFICFTWGIDGCNGYADVIGVEVKSNGYLDKIEKAKCKWLIENKIFSRILIAQKGKKRGEIVYKEFGGNLL